MSIPGLPMSPSDTQPPRDKDSEIDRLRATIAELQKPPANKEKDAWDKAGVVSQFLSGFVIAILAIFASLGLHELDSRQKRLEIEVNADQSEAQMQVSERQAQAQRKLSAQQSKDELALQRSHDDAELDLENRKNYSAFLLGAAGASPQDRGRLVSQMESVLTPEQAIQVAAAYLHPPPALEDKEIYQGDLEVYSSALSALQHFSRKDARGVLARVANSAMMPDKEVAKGLLGQFTRVQLRVSKIDDFGTLTLNGEPIIKNNKVLPRLVFDEDTDWMDITDQLKGDGQTNVLDFLVENGEAGGFGGRLQLSAGANQYDTGAVAKNTCPCGTHAEPATAEHQAIPARPAKAFEVKLYLKVPKTRPVQILGDETRFY